MADGTNTYLYGLGRLAQQQTNMQYLGVDGLGSVRQLYNSSGQIIANHRYDSFGNTISQSGVGSSTYGFTGEQQDATGLDYSRALLRSCHGTLSQSRRLGRKSAESRIAEWLELRRTHPCCVSEED